MSIVICNLTGVPNSEDTKIFVTLSGTKGLPHVGHTSHAKRWDSSLPTVVQNDTMSLSLGTLNRLIDFWSVDGTRCNHLVRQVR